MQSIWNTLHRHLQIPKSLHGVNLKGKGDMMSYPTCKIYKTSLNWAIERLKISCKVMWYKTQGAMEFHMHSVYRFVAPANGDKQKEKQ